jgi:fatty acid/phospholipid biosynthesis enzyme
MKHRFDYEQYGGAPLLGVRGVSIVTHWAGAARMLENASGSPRRRRARIPQLIAEWTASTQPSRATTPPS